MNASLQNSLSGSIFSFSSVNEGSWKNLSSKSLLILECYKAKSTGRLLIYPGRFLFFWGTGVGISAWTFSSQLVF